jgi:hypothetical protein
LRTGRDAAEGEMTCAPPGKGLVIVPEKKRLTADAQRR